MIFFMADSKEAAKEAANASIEHLNKATRAWELSAARGDCGWICADCGCSFPEGMPDACIHEQQSCTDLIKRDKLEARKA